MSTTPARVARATDRAEPRQSTPALEEAAEVLADVRVRLAQEAATARQQTRTPA